MKPSYLNTPHPYLSEPVLYAADIPNRIKWKHVANMFSPWGLASSGGRSTVPGTTRKILKVIFPDLFIAEMALATMNGVQVRGVDPPWYLSLFHSPLLDEQEPDEPTLPMFIRDIDTKEPADTVIDPQAMFRRYRKAGPLVSIRLNVDVGYESAACVLQYWQEEHAKCALSMSAGKLQIYDPWNLYCINLGAQVRDNDLHEQFAQFGDILEARVVKPGHPEAFGFVSFQTKEQAARAKHYMNGSMLGDSEISIRYHEPKAQSKLRPHTGARATYSVFAEADYSEPRPEWKTENEPRKPTPQPAGTTQLDEELQERLNEARTRRILAERVEKEAKKAKEEALQREDDKKKEVTLVFLEQEEADEIHEQAKFAFEEAARSLSAIQARLGRIMLNKERGIAEWRAATESREAAEREEVVAQKNREIAEWKEREAELEESRSKLEELRKQEEADRQNRTREAELAESRRKMAEFEAEERHRKFAQKEEEQAREAAERKKEERERRAREEEERKARELREKEARAQAEAQERLRRYEEATQRERLRCKQRDNSNPKGKRRPWTAARSVARFRLVSAEFDEIKFCTDQPLTFDSIPWPTLHSPYVMKLEHIEWQAVESFFEQLRSMVNDGEYRALVEKTHRRFHPDKWRSRGLLNTILDEETRKEIEDAGNVVAQALTPIWLESRAK